MHSTIVKITRWWNYKLQALHSWDNIGCEKHDIHMEFCNMTQKWEDDDDKINHKWMDSGKESYIELNSSCFVAAGSGIAAMNIELWRMWEDVGMTYYMVIWLHFCEKGLKKSMKNLGQGKLCLYCRSDQVFVRYEAWMITTTRLVADFCAVVWQLRNNVCCRPAVTSLWPYLSTCDVWDAMCELS